MPRMTRKEGRDGQADSGRAAPGLPSSSIETPRLRLLPMTPEFLAASVAGDRDAMVSTLDAEPADEWPDDPRVLELWHARAGDAMWVAWGPHAIVLRDGRRMIGHAGYHAPPGAAYLKDYAPGAVEMGYTVYPAYRARGFATEAVRGLIDNAYLMGVRRFVLSIAPDNTASLAVARKLGFVTKVASHVDPVDGPEDVYLLEQDEERRPLGGL